MPTIEQMQQILDSFNLFWAVGLQLIEEDIFEVNLKISQDGELSF